MFTEESLKKRADADVDALIKINSAYWDGDRYKIIKGFCKPGGKILSVGCAVREPIIIGATHACDLSPKSGPFLAGNGWRGDFKVASCLKLPYADKSFDIAVLSEVIEHLPGIAAVIDAMCEISRVAKRFIITTPNSAKIKPQCQNPNHILFFTEEIIKRIIPFKARVYLHDYHIYIEGCDDG